MRPPDEATVDRAMQDILKGSNEYIPTPEGILTYVSCGNPSVPGRDVGLQFLHHFGEGRVFFHLLLHLADGLLFFHKTAPYDYFPYVILFSFLKRAFGRKGGPLINSFTISAKAGSFFIFCSTWRME